MKYTIIGVNLGSVFDKHEFETYGDALTYCKSIRDTSVRPPAIILLGFDRKEVHLIRTEVLWAPNYYIEWDGKLHGWPKVSTKRYAKLFGLEYGGTHAGGLE